MAKNLYMYEEKWDTRFGNSPRFVIRDSKGRFVDNVSKRQIRKGERALEYTTSR